MAKTKMDDLKEVLRYHLPTVGNLVRLEKTSKNRYLVVTDKLNGVMQEHDGFYFLGYITDCDEDGIDDAIGLMVLTERTLVRRIQTHTPERTLSHWEEKMSNMSATEMEEDLIQTYSILRHLQRRG